MSEISPIAKPVTVQEAIKLLWNEYKKLINTDGNARLMVAMGMAIKALEDRRWIPVTERLPNCNGCYLVWRPHFFGGEIGMPSICYFDGQDTWHDSYGVDFERVLKADDVTAWMPLPESYDEGAEDEAQFMV
jgi:hypothetical protein